MSGAPQAFTLEDFSLKGMHLARMTGVMIASHAMPDSFLLMHSGVGCKYKTAAQGARHDLLHHPNEREAWTQISEQHLVQGCSQRLGPFARAWWERRHSKIMVVVSAYFIELTGDDMRAELNKVEATLPDCDMVYLNTAAPQMGFFDGYAGVMREVCARMDWSRPPVAPGRATVLGFFFHRYENDVKADVAQVRALVKAGGLEPGPVLFSGQPYEELKTAPDSGVLLALPYTQPHTDAILANAGRRRVVHLDLPMGFSGTRRFVREVGLASGMPEAKLEAWLAQQEQGVRAAIGPFEECFRDASLAVFADAPLAAGLVTLLVELGVRVPVVGLRDTRGALGGEDAFRATLARNGVELDPSTVVLEAPSLRRTRDVLKQYALSGRLRGMVSSSHERSVVDFDPDFDARFARFEAGFPQDRQHSVLMRPSFGFAGIATWAQRILDRVWEQSPLESRA